MPWRTRASIWSFISAISGETTTRDAVEQQRRELVAEALAGPGREHRERGAPGEQRLDDPLLAGPEVGEAEPGGEHRTGIDCFHLWQHSRRAGGRCLPFALRRPQPQPVQRRLAGAR